MQGKHPDSYSLQYSIASLPHTIGGFNFPVQSTIYVSITITSPMRFTLPPIMLFLSPRSPTRSLPEYRLGYSSRGER